MGPSRRVLGGAIVMTMCVVASLGTHPAAAQDYENSLRSLDYAPDPLTRSPRLLGMGRLTLANDLHNHINLWDFAGSPAGLADAESLSTVEYRPGTRSSTGYHDLDSDPTPHERQQLGARQMRQNIEGWRRTSPTTAYGLTGELATLQWDRPFNGVKEERGTFTVPSITAIVNSRLPWLRSTRFDLGVRLSTSRETYDDLYYDYFLSPQGEYLGHPTAEATAPDVFTPNQTSTSTVTGGLALAMHVTSGLKAAIGYDRGSTTIQGNNDALRSTSRIDEKRPIEVGQATLVGRVGRHLEFGADGRAWRSNSQEYFFWSVSAGPAQEPLVGEGKRLDRRIEGTAVRSRARWVSGPFEIGASFGTSFRRNKVTPWYQSSDSEPESFNEFLDVVGFRTGADTLSLPPRVQAALVEERGYDMAAGGSWGLSGGRGTLGAEAHRWRARIDQPTVASGPEPQGWDVRAGAEYRCLPSLLARAGWSYGISDRDRLTSDDAFRHTTASTGFGYQAIGSRWSVDLGFALDWVDPDFGDPIHTRERHQQLAIQSRWVF